MQLSHVRVLTDCQPWVAVLCLYNLRPLKESLYVIVIVNLYHDMLLLTLQKDNSKENMLQIKASNYFSDIKNSWYVS